MSRRTATVATSIAFLVLAGLIGACSGSKNAAGGSASPAGTGFRPIAVPEPVEGGNTGVAGPVPAGGGRDALGETGLAAKLPAISPKIIKDATVSVDVKKGSFDQQFQQATQIAGRHGGFVASSRTADERRRTGTIVIRIPADQFEAAFGELKGLGKVRSQGVNGQDVTSQFVDLQARLRNWETQETVLLKLLAKSKTIDESIKVQRAIQDVQLAIEEIRGQLRVLDDQTAFSTITLSMTEAGPVVERPGKRSALSRAWHEALDGFVAVIAAVVIGIGYLLPVVMMGLAILLGW